MRIACLMAGKCTRLLPLTATEHKAMLEVARYPLIDLQSQIFELAGITAFTFVLGHGAASLAQRILNRQPRFPTSIIYNNHYESRNLDWSAFLGLSAERGDVLYYEGDILAQENILRDVIACPADICIAVDRTGQSDQVDTKVLVKGNSVQRLIFSEHQNAVVPPGSESAGEFVCMMKMSDQVRDFVCRELEQASFDSAMTLYSIFDKAFIRFPARYILTEGRAWIEIDNQRDLLRAQGVGRRILEQIGRQPH